jgi:hypothetical protein
VNIDYGFVLVPEQLTALGYQDIEWLAGMPGIRKGWHQEIVRARKGKETIVLRSGNNIVPWSTIRRVPCRNVTAEKLLKLLKF